MTTPRTSLAQLSDEQLLAEVTRLAGLERQATAALIRSLMELDARRLYLAQGFSSLFTYCTQALHLSEHAALGRIEVARATRRLPAILDLLLDGSVTVTNVRLLASHLTEDNHRDLLHSARHKSKREVEEIVARLRPLPDIAASVRKVPARRAIASPVATRLESQSGQSGTTEPGSLLTSAAPEPVAVARSVEPRPVVAPLAPERYKVQFTVSGETHQKLRRAQDLLRHAIPNGDPAAIFDRALTLLVEQLEKQKCAATPQPRPPAGAKPGSRRIPAGVRREVWKRDEGRCAFVGLGGRCRERGFLEFHHVWPFAEGGQSVAANIELRCRAHDLFESELFFGADTVRERAPTWG